MDSFVLGVKPMYGRIENYGSPRQTFFILSLRADGIGEEELARRLRLGVYHFSLIVQDEDAASGEACDSAESAPARQEARDLAVQYPALEFPAAGGFSRLPASRAGLTLRTEHSYTLTVEITEGDRVIAAGESERGAFRSTQEDFLREGEVVHRVIPPDPDSPLRGKTALFAGDSLTEAICEVKIPYYGVSAGWPGRVGARNRLHFISTGTSGESISTVKNPIERQLVAQAGRPVDFVVFNGGVNDGWFEAPLGGITPEGTDPDLFERESFAGGLEHLIFTARQTFPDATLCYLISPPLLGRWYSSAEVLGYLDDLSPLFDLSRRICRKWGVPYLNLYDNPTVASRMRINTTFAMADYIHPNDKGYDILSPFVDQFLRAVAAGKSQEEIDTLPDPPYSDPCPTIEEGERDLARGCRVVDGEGRAFPEATDGDWETSSLFGRRIPGGAPEEQPFVELDLGEVCEVRKLRVSNFGPCMNLLYQYRVYGAAERTLPLSRWTLLCENDHAIASGQGLIFAFPPAPVRYLRLVPFGWDGENRFYVSSIEVYG